MEKSFTFDSIRDKFNAVRWTSVIEYCPLNLLKTVFVKEHFFLGLFGSNIHRKSFTFDSIRYKTNAVRWTSVIEYCPLNHLKTVFVKEIYFKDFLGQI